MLSFMQPGWFRNLLGDTHTCTGMRYMNITEYITLFCLGHRDQNLSWLLSVSPE